MNKDMGEKGTDTTRKYWPTLLRVLLFCTLCAIALATSSGFLSKVKGFWVQVATVVIAIMFSLMLSKLFAWWERIKMNDIGFAPSRNRWSGFFTGLAAGLGLAVLQSLLVLASGHIKLEPVPAITFRSILSSFMLYLTIAAREEVAFRGFPVLSLQRATGPRFALLIVGIIFVVEHKIGGMNWWPAIFGPGVGSILFGLAAIKTKSLALPFGLHSAWNFGQWSMGFKNEPGILKVIIEKGYEGRVEVTGWIGYLFVMSIAILILYYFKKNNIEHA